jgi:hypothetical protein
MHRFTKHNVRSLATILLRMAFSVTVSSWFIGTIQRATDIPWD